MKLKNKEKNGGITLIALIITIIVLLILAGVSILMLSGENGIFNRAGEASESTKEANVREKVKLAVMETITDKNGLGVFDTSIFEGEVKKLGGEIVEQTEDEIIVEMDGYEVTVDAKTGEIIDIGKAGGVKAEFDTKLYQTDGSEPAEDIEYEELVLTVNVTNEDKIGEGEIKIAVTAPNGENVEANGAVTGEGEKSFKVDQNGEYTVTVETTVEEITRKVTKKVEVNSIEIPEFSRTYGTIDIRFISGTGNETKEGTKANAPILGENMKAVNFNGKDGWTELEGTEGWNYNYTNSPGESEWANAVVKEGDEITGYYVWIPRYAYKITYHDGSLEGNVIGYSDSRGIVRKDDNVERVFTGGKGRRNAGDNYIVHPAFTNDVNVGGWGSEIGGIWVAKYEASGSTTEIKILPGKLNLRDISISDVYKASKNYNTKLNSHLMKNSEWGACCYLSYSNYGIGPERKVAQNKEEGYITGGSSIMETIFGQGEGQNAGQSTTGNAYGVYDMNGGASEYVASYVNNGDSSVSSNGSIFAPENKINAKSSNMVTVYKASNSETEETLDNEATNYSLSGKFMFGDAIFETSTAYSNSTGSWQDAFAYFPCSSTPFFGRGGTYNNPHAGLFYFYYNNGNYGINCVFRMVLVR